MKSWHLLTSFQSASPLRVLSYAIGTLCSPKVLVKYALLAVAEHLRFDARDSFAQDNGLSMFLAPFRLLTVSNKNLLRVTNGRNN